MADSILSHPDLASFKVVPPREDLRLDDFKLPDGTPMRGPDGLLIPEARDFSMVVNGAQRIYSYRFDEAMRSNFVAARAMRRDAFILGLLEERILPTINRKWQVEVPDAADANQRYVQDEMTKLVDAIPDFDAYKRALLDGVWFGRAGVQQCYARNPLVGNRWTVPKWDPIHGDSVQFTFDGVPAILMDTMTAGWYAARGATRGPWGDVRSTDRGGMALVLQNPYWRDRFVIHQHIRQKADFFEGELAGSVQGLGLRGQVYWQYVVRTDALTWMLAYMQSVGQMDMLIFNYPTGDHAAKLQQQANANKIIGKAAFICPRPAGGNWPAVEQLSMNDAGLKALHDLVAEYFDRHIERLIVGQSMSAGLGGPGGLEGDGRADFARACVPVAGSEILTRDGFKKPEDVQVGEEVLAYDHETDQCKWTPLLKKSFYPDAPLVKLSDATGQYEAVCTPEHTWAVAHKGGLRSLQQAKDVTADQWLVVTAPSPDGDRFHPAFDKQFRFVDRVTSTDAGRADVWCPTTKYGTWVMRQNGRVMITGNTKDEILVYDTNRLDNVLTRDLIAPLMKYNFKWAKFQVKFKSVLPNLEGPQKVEAGVQLVMNGISVKVDEMREAAGFSKPEEGDEIVGGMPPMMPGMDPMGGMPPDGGAGLPPEMGGMPVPGMPAGPSDMGAGGPPMQFSGGSDQGPPTEYDAGGGSPAPSGGPAMGFPGGGNTYIPKFGNGRQLARRKSDDAVGFTRYATRPVAEVETDPNLSAASKSALVAKKRTVNRRAQAGYRTRQSTAEPGDIAARVGQKVAALGRPARSGELQRLLNLTATALRTAQAAGEGQHFRTEDRPANADGGGRVGTWFYPPEQYARPSAPIGYDEDLRPRAWHLTSNQARSLLDSAADKEQLRHVEHVLRDVWPDYTEAATPDTGNDYAYQAWRAANRGDEIPRFDFTDFNTRHRLAVKRALAAGAPVPQHVFDDHGLGNPPTDAHRRVEAMLPDVVRGQQYARPSAPTYYQEPLSKKAKIRKKKRKGKQ